MQRAGRPAGALQQSQGGSSAPRAGALTIEQLIDIKHPSAPMWAPDGNHVVFQWERAGVATIYAADATATRGAAPRELAGAGSQLAGAFWGADGALMVARGGALRRVPVDRG